MKTEVLTAIIQGLVQIITIVGSIWALINKKTSQMESRFDAKITRLDHKVSSIQHSYESREHKGK